MVGTQTAKDLILGVDAQGGRIKLDGTGPGRMHWMRTVRPDYYDQLTAEVKVPHKSVRGRLVWQCKSGRRNEALDCEVYALHAARSMKVNLWRAERWEVEESVITQPALFGDSAALAVVPAAAQSSEITTRAAEVGDDLNVGADNPGPGKPETVVQTPARPAQQPKKQAVPPPRNMGWSAKNW